MPATSLIEASVSICLGLYLRRNRNNANKACQSQQPVCFLDNEQKGSLGAADRLWLVWRQSQDKMETELHPDLTVTLEFQSSKPYSDCELIQTNAKVLCVRGAQKSLVGS